MTLRYDRYVLLVIMGLFDLFLVIHEHEVSLSVSLVSIRIADVSNELHLLFTVLVGLSCQDPTGKLLSILGTFVDDRHILKVVNVRALYNKDSASNFENVADSQGVQSALLTFCTQSEPGTIRRTHISQVESSSLLLIGSRSSDCHFVADLGMVVAHLRVFLYTKSVLLVSTNGQTRLVNWNHPISGRALKYMQFNHCRLRCRHNFEFRKPHLEHHMVSKCDLLAHHDESTSGRPNVSQVEIGQVSIA